MRFDLGRRAFLSMNAANLTTLAMGAEPGKRTGVAKQKPLVVASPNGLTTVRKVMARLRSNFDPLDAILDSVAEVQADPKDDSIGYGGFPNMQGNIELDAQVMHGPTHGLGAVAALRNIKNPAALAKAVMEKSPNCLLVGDGARIFAKTMGFAETDLMTDEIRKVWETARRANGMVKGAPKPTPEEMGALNEMFTKHSWLGAISCLSLDTHGDIAGLSMNPGSIFKFPGRVGDTPIPGASLYLDNEVGACASTGFGEYNLMNCSCFLVIENLRKGMTPKDACVAACRRVAMVTKRNPRFRNDDGKLTGSVTFYCLSKSGKFGGAKIGGPTQMAVHDGESARIVEVAGVTIR